MSELISSAMKEFVLDCKSRPVYDRWMARYMKFKLSHGLTEDEFGVYMDFLRDVSTHFKVSTVWQAASCLNKFMMLDGCENYIQNPVFKGFMKQLEKSYVPNKASVMELGEVNRFLCEYENCNEGLLMKVAMIIAIHGGLRVSDLTALNFKDVHVVGSSYEITIQQLAKATDQASHKFTITPSPVSSVCPCSYISQYFQLFVNPSGRFFRKFGNNGQPLQQPIGVNSMAKIPAKVAHFLGLKGNFTGHCFRRTSATIFLDDNDNGSAGVNHIHQLKRQGRRKSTPDPEEYVDQTAPKAPKAPRIEISNMLNGNSLKLPISALDKFVNCHFHNCSVNITFH